MPFFPARRRAAAAAFLLSCAAPPAAAADGVDFARDIRPVLSNACFKCHGPATQKAKLRLDGRAAAVKAGAVVPGKPAESALFERISLPDTDGGRMPPEEAGHRLAPEQIAAFKAWIEQGAEYAPHWAFAKPVRPAPPAVRNPKADLRNEIDRFVLARLERQGLAPAPPAGNATSIRRVSLDLTGLLPTPEELDEFLDDESPGAYEEVVDRLLASPHYGERQARHWLDLARYADSNGYTIDGPRSIWPYRDWVIGALNADLPFDRFTVEQLAGDLLPHATKDQIIATGFHRNTSFNEEGGTDAEQFRVERTVDRTNTTGAVWLGLTVGCAQCHDHKYDPIGAKEYYRLYAYFNSCDEPTLPLGGAPDLEKRIAGLQAELAALRLTGNDAAVKVKLTELKKVEGQVPSTLVMRERKAGRPTFVQVRGDFLRKGEPVTPGTPAALQAVEPSAAPNGTAGTRLELANWLVSPDNPLTARVTVNREWQKFFGRGLVETENDFGMQGSSPTHPELLDWLAVAFVRDDGWSLKKLHRRIVTSAAYRRASAHRADLAAEDPRNLLLGRQSRLRLEAEIIRDAALSAAGLLNPKVGGPGFYPPQSAEVFSFTQSKRTWPESQGAERYRRGMYTYVWRQAQHPLFTTFDGADAQTACTHRNRSNTPLQALHLANDPAFVEFAAALGKRVAEEGPADDGGRIDYAFKVCFSRPPTAGERARLLGYLAAERKARPEAAWTAVGRVLLNLDEFVTRE